jgi:hypothetical protein
MNISRQTRFDDVVRDESGRIECEYHGVDYELIADGRTFEVRTYDDEPSVAIVGGFLDPRVDPEARALVRFIQTQLGCDRIKFYSKPDGFYRFVDTQTLRFEEQ